MAKQHLLMAIAFAVVACVGLISGDSHLTHRDWLVGTVLFGTGLVATGLTFRQLRRAGLIR